MSFMRGGSGSTRIPTRGKFRERLDDLRLRHAFFRAREDRRVNASNGPGGART
jgi:hypothetical protein